MPCYLSNGRYPHKLFTHAGSFFHAIMTSVTVAALFVPGDGLVARAAIHGANFHMDIANAAVVSQWAVLFPVVILVMCL